MPTPPIVSFAENIFVAISIGIPHTENCEKHWMRFPLQASVQSVFLNRWRILGEFRLKNRNTRLVQKFWVEEN
jgi:hypothetical protein